MTAYGSGQETNIAFQKSNLFSFISNNGAYYLFQLASTSFSKVMYIYLDVKCFNTRCRIKLFVEHLSSNRQKALKSMVKKSINLMES